MACRARDQGLAGTQECSRPTTHTHRRAHTHIHARIYVHYILVEVRGPCGYHVHNTNIFTRLGILSLTSGKHVFSYEAREGFHVYMFCIFVKQNMLYTSVPCFLFCDRRTPTAIVLSSVYASQTGSRWYNGDHNTYLVKHRDAWRSQAFFILKISQAHGATLYIIAFYWASSDYNRWHVWQKTRE